MRVPLHMNRAVGAMLLVLACARTARADEGDPPAYVQPFLDEVAENVRTARGALGPAKDTTIVVSYDLRGATSFRGFALVPDARARGGYRKLPLPRLPAPALDGESRVALIGNLDKDPADEVVLEMHVQKTVGPTGGFGGYTYSAYEYVVIDWDGKQLVRLPALERKLAARMQARAGDTSAPLTDDDLRGLLGLGRK